MRVHEDDDAFEALRQLVATARTVVDMLIIREGDGSLRFAAATCHRNAPLQVA